MRNEWLVVCLLAAGVMSCDDAFDPHGEFADLPVLYCVMEASALGPAPQSAVLTRTVPSRGLLENSNGLVLPAISGADITIVGTQGSFDLEETLDTLHAGSPEEQVQLIYRNPSVRLRPTDPVSISALLPDGRVLTASTVVPTYLYFEMSYKFPHGFTTAVNPLTRGTVWSFSWEPQAGHLHFPELILTYSVLRTDSVAESRAVRVPQQFLLQGGQETPVYPQPTFERSCGFEYTAIDEIFARLARDEGPVLELTVHSLIFTVTTFDTPLANFYTSARGSMDPYSIRVDEVVYSNISGGGIGVFGTYVVSRLEIAIDPAYARSFGYESK